MISGIVDNTLLVDEYIVDLDIAPCEDIHSLQQYEYWLQLSMMMPDLHITRAWTLCKHSKHEEFLQFASVLNGPVVLSWFDIGKLPSGNTVQDIFTRGMKVFWPYFLLSTGVIDVPDNFAQRTFRYIRNSSRDCELSIFRTPVERNIFSCFLQLRVISLSFARLLLVEQ